MSCTNCSADETPVKQFNVTVQPFDFWRDLNGNAPDGVTDHEDSITHNGPITVGGLTPTPGKVATFFGDIDVLGQIDPNSVVFSDAPVGITTAWDSAANNFYKIGVIGVQRPLVLMPITDVTNAIQDRRADGVTVVTNTDTLNGRFGINTTAPKAALDVGGAVIHRQVNLADFAANAVLGTATSTVDQSSVISINQTTPGVTVTIPNPTLIQAGRLLIIENLGTTPITVDTTSVANGKHSPWVWSGTKWVPLAASGGGGSTDDFWRSGTAAALKTPDATTDTTENVSRSGNVGIGINDPSTLVARLDVSGSQVLRAVNVANLAANGSVGTAAATVDIASTLVLAQTTANIALTLSNPTNATAGRVLFVTHNGTAATTVGGKAISPGETLTFIWDGNSWNANAAPIVADFWRSGTTATTLPDGTTDVTEGIVHNGFVGIGATAAFTNATTLAAALDVSGSAVLRPVSLANFAANAAIGTAAATVDVASTITINQTAGNISLTIPTPTNAQAGRVLNISNIGTAQVKIAGQYITPGTGQSYVWTGAAWTPLGDNPDVVLVNASRNLAPTDHLKTLLATNAVTLTCPANLGYLLIRVRQQGATDVITLVGAAGVTRVAPYGASTVGIAGTSLIVEVYNNTMWIE